MKTETEPKQTAMQRLISQIESMPEFGLNDCHIMKVYRLAESLLPEERKEIEESYNLGSARTEYDDGFGINLTISSEQYFETKFKQ